MSPGFVLLAGSVEGRSSDPTLLADLLAATAVDPPVAEPEVLIETAPAAGPELQIPLEPRVLHELEQFQGRLRGDLHDALRRARPYLPLVTQVLREEGLPLDLAYIPLVESAFDPQATSRTQAKGLWQLVGGTARSLGLRQDAGVDERNDPEKSTRAAARYLSQLVETFQGDWLLALAGYNAGPARVREAIRRSGRHDFWALSRTDEFLPQQTRTYVPKVLAAILIGRAPSHYGFDVDPSTP